MVCLGNICRSPLAAGILKYQLNKLNINGSVDSAGFEPYHNGEPADDRAQDIAKKHNIDISDHRARLFRKGDFDEYDHIYVMDESNYKDVMFMVRNDADKSKVDYIMNVINPGKNEVVPDPYYGGLYQFQEIYEMLEKACKKIAENYK